ncbi:MAG TPA: lytic transglycosylase domain-containing protein [Vicinamibacterales bacterium]|jgi:soluble lytic murein transglycosylase-like protein|nr:lytic transglycosylase domain-containing protein [Vicinamibacterales bacterium]
MPLELPLGLRHEERRHSHDRRQSERGSRDRRRGDRRRRTLQSLLFGICAMAIPHHTGLSQSETNKEPQSMISVSEHYRAVPARIAYNDAIAEAAGRYGLDPNLIRAIIHAESAFNPFAVSDAGAQGLMQLMPDVSEQLALADPFDPRQNILAGSKYLKDLLDRHHGNIDLAVASYNAGPGAVKRYRGVPPYRETRNYVKTVKIFLKQERRSSSD